MNTRDHIEATGVPLGCCPTKDEWDERVRQTENQQWQTAQILSEMAIKAQMLIHDMDRDTAKSWINKALKKSE
jgi:hypothetical protein